MEDILRRIRLLEAEDKAKDKTKDIDIEMDTDDSKGEVGSPVNNKNSDAPKPKSPVGGKADANVTRKGGDSSKLNPSDFDMIKDIFDLEDTVSDEEAYKNYAGDEVTSGVSDPVTPDNLPDVINSKVFDPSKKGKTNVRPPKWHMVKHLPGYIQQGIRALGRMVFAPFTNTPIEEIQVMASVLDSRDTNVMADWIRRNGMKNEEATISAQEILHGYNADIQIWNAEGITFMLVKDHIGEYIYAWPSKNEIADMRNLAGIN